jgi:hypothetical protein
LYECPWPAELGYAVICIASPYLMNSYCFWLWTCKLSADSVHDIVTRVRAGIAWLM